MVWRFGCGHRSGVDRCISTRGDPCGIEILMFKPLILRPDAPSPWTHCTTRQGPQHPGKRVTQADPWLEVGVGCSYAGWGASEWWWVRRSLKDLAIRQCLLEFGDACVGDPCPAKVEPFKPRESL